MIELNQTFLLATHYIKDRDAVIEWLHGYCASTLIKIPSWPDLCRSGLKIGDFSERYIIGHTENWQGRVWTYS